MSTPVSKKSSPNDGNLSERGGFKDKTPAKVLDEPSAALDAASEAVVSAALDGLSCTKLVVAHRLATIKGADRIYVLDRGRVVESGAHDDLVRAGGTYAAMVAKQSFSAAPAAVVS